MPRLDELQPQFTWPPVQGQGLDALVSGDRGYASPLPAARFFGQGAAQFLGLPEAVQALRGQQTPEEAQNFFMGQIPGLLGPEVKLGAAVLGAGAAAKVAFGSKLQEALARIAKMGDVPLPTTLSQTVQEALARIAKKGDVPLPTGDVPLPTLKSIQESLARVPDYLPPIGDVPLPTLKSLPEYYSWDYYDLPLVGQPIHNTSYPSQPIHNTSYPSEYGWSLLGKPWDPATVERLKQVRTEGVPGTMPAPIPERAIQAGFNVPLAHGTTSFTPFEEFKLPDELSHGLGQQVGVHAGSPKAANQFAVRADYLTGDLPRVYPLVMRPGKSLTLADLGSWDPARMRDALERLPEFSGQTAGAKTAQQVRDLIKSKGYESIMYENAVEDPGHTSYIALDPAQFRVPWAAFKDLKSRNLLSGLLGGAVVAPAVVQGQRE